MLRRESVVGERNHSNEAGEGSRHRKKQQGAFLSIRISILQQLSSWLPRSYWSPTPRICATASLRAQLCCGLTVFLPIIGTSREGLELVGWLATVFRSSLSVPLSTLSVPLSTIFIHFQRPGSYCQSPLSSRSSPSVSYSTHPSGTVSV